MAKTLSVLTVPAGASDVHLCYRRRGTGEPLLLLHGIGHHLQAWEPVSDALAASYDVIELDLPGFGQSTPLPPDHAHDVPSVVEVLARACTALGTVRPHVAGNSLGGMLALGMGRAGHARSVTALSPGGFWNEPERRYAFTVLRGMRLGARGLPEALVTRLARTAAGRFALTGTIYAKPSLRAPSAVEAELRALRAAPGFARTLAAGRAAAFRDDVTSVPVTIAWGDRDRLLLPRQGLRAKRTIPGARLVRLRGCGHVPMNDDPAQVVRVISETAR
ncbi:alpha/beta fold hydrolase [Streptomyces sp. JJ66]|uniref:alpha/beta fold hydrolase n=1 Tax=Streptomyces sp. JJ66 TaxID=2803843 RepID=UPI001C562D17|nr:alpha/beta fold hydrolase [Streptomyces sp. JJ66]MBW1603310.1 alpha/beta fold hydrolase [Streptomyces sp. JJ66]